LGRQKALDEKGKGVRFNVSELPVDAPIITPRIQNNAALYVCLDLKPFDHFHHASCPIMRLDKTAMALNDLRNVLEQLRQSIRVKEGIFLAKSIEIPSSSRSNPLTDISPIHV
jgi:hypothetical protein